MYTFHDLVAGTYCLGIDAAADGNDSVLIPGNWTVPYRWYGPGPISVEVALGSDDDISRLNDFAWDYQFLPSPVGALPSGTPFARVLTDARCRLGPSYDYPTLTYLSQGLSFPITGRLEQGGWWQLRAADIQLPCWIAEDVVEPNGDLSGVPLAIPPGAAYAHTHRGAAGARLLVPDQPRSAASTPSRARRSASRACPLARHASSDHGTTESSVAVEEER